MWLGIMHRTGDACSCAPASQTEQLAGQPTKGEASLAHEELSREKREERETESAGGRVIREGNGEDRRRYT